MPEYSNMYKSTGVGAMGALSLCAIAACVEIISLHYVVDGMTHHVESSRYSNMAGEAEFEGDSLLAAEYADSSEYHEREAERLRVIGEHTSPF